MKTKSKERKSVVRGISMTPATDIALKKICQLTGLSIASCIAMCINTYYVENLDKINKFEELIHGSTTATE